MHPTPVPSWKRAASLWAPSGHLLFTFKCPQWRGPLSVVHVACRPLPRTPPPRPHLFHFPLRVFGGIVHSARDVLKPASPAKEDEILRAGHAAPGNKKISGQQRAQPTCSKYRAPPHVPGLQWGEQRRRWCRNVNYVILPSVHSLMLPCSFWLHTMSFSKRAIAHVYSEVTQKPRAWGSGCGGFK